MILIIKGLPKGNTKFQRDDSFTTALIYGRKDDRENLEDDLDQRQCQFLLELSSALQDKVPSPGIVFPWMIQSNDVIGDRIFSFSLLTVSAPPCKGIKVGGTSKIGYVHHVPA